MIEKEIIKAKELFERYGQAMKENSPLFDLLERYRLAIGETQAFMNREGIVDACAGCADDGGGG